MDQIYQIFFAHSFDLMAIVGTDGYFKRTNPAFEQVLGYSEEEMLSKPLAELLHPDDVAKTNAGIQILGKGIVRLGSINRYRCKDGSYRWFSWNTRPMGDLLYTIGRDVTEQVQSDEKIRQLNLELERRNEDLEIKIRERMAELGDKEGQLQQLQKLDAVGRLAGGISHDFNNILGAILMHCDLMARKGSDAEIVKDCIEEIEKATARGAALTRQLLIFSRKKFIEFQAVQLNDLLKTHFKMLSRLIGENIKVEFQLCEKIPFISADPGQLEQVIMNLVINARDAMPQGGKLTVETKYEELTEEFASTHLSSKLGPHVLLSIADTGCGMDEKTKNQIFEPFFTTKPVGQGTGLGLSTVYGIVKSLEGTIWVYSEPQKGTVFKVYIPATEGQFFKETTETESKSLVGKETIMIVEDDMNLRALYGDALEQYGYKVLLAENGKIALEMLGKQGAGVDLIVTDMIMPEMGGLELAKEVFAESTNMKILCISGYPGDDSDLKFIEDTRIGYLQKPFNTTALVQKIRSLLDRRDKLEASGDGIRS